MKQKKRIFSLDCTKQKAFPELLKVLKDRKQDVFDMKKILLTNLKLRRKLLQGDWKVFQEIYQIQAHADIPVKIF